MKSFQEIFSKDNLSRNSVSSNLKDMMNFEFDEDCSIADKAKSIVFFQMMCDLIEKLGIVEHSGDWDLYLMIELEGQTIETPSGYSEIEIVGDTRNMFHEDNCDLTIKFVSGIDEDNDYNEIWDSVKVSQIKSIRLVD